MSLPPDLLAAAKLFAYENNESLSAIVVRLLNAEMLRASIMPSASEIGAAVIESRIYPQSANPAKTPYP